MSIEIDKLKTDKFYYDVWKTLLAKIIIEEYEKMKKAKEYVNKNNLKKVAFVSAENFLNVIIKIQKEMMKNEKRR